MIVLCGFRSDLGNGLSMGYLDNALSGISLWIRSEWFPVTQYLFLQFCAFNPVDKFASQMLILKG
jgi:hypothetical protein